jgi:hypothetical protein
MKTDLQKEMRQIRIQLKQYDVTDEKKIILREQLERLRVLLVKEKKQITY